MQRWRWVLSQYSRKISVHATAYAVLGLLAAVIAIWVQTVIPWALPDWVGVDAVDSLLNIIASSMLAVTTFSLSAMTAAYGAATTNVTPRATKLLIEDRLSQQVLSTFVGSFIFSIVGIIVLKTGAYGASGRMVLFVFTIGVVALIVINLLRWIVHLTQLGRVGETTLRVEQVTQAALDQRLSSPYLGGVALSPDRQIAPAGARLYLAKTIGYLQHIDMFALSDCAELADSDIHVLLNPGAFVYLDTVIAWSARDFGDDDDAKDAFDQAVRAAFTVGDTRLFDQDPRFGLAVLSEVGSRALSAAINDSGTALDVIGRTTRLLAVWGERGAVDADVAPQHPRIHVARLKDQDLFEDAFMVIARDGAALVEVQLRLRKSLAALARLGDDTFRAAARQQAAIALDRANRKIESPSDLERLHDIDV